MTKGIARHSTPTRLVKVMGKSERDIAKKYNRKFRALPPAEQYMLLNKITEQQRQVLFSVLRYR